MNTIIISWWVKAAGGYGSKPYHLHVPNVFKSGSLKLLEPSGPFQTCTGVVLPFFSRCIYTNIIRHRILVKIGKKNDIFRAFVKHLKISLQKLSHFVSNAPFRRFLNKNERHSVFRKVVSRTHETTPCQYSEDYNTNSHLHRYNVLISFK